MSSSTWRPMAPERIVAKSGSANRVGRIFIDYLRNGRGATTAAAFSARARPGLGVSVPCSWDEIGGLRGGDHWTVATVQDRLESAADPWDGYAALRQTLGPARKALHAMAPRMNGTAQRPPGFGDFARPGRPATLPRHARPEPAIEARIHPTPTR